MSSPAQSRGLRKGTRDLFQSVLAVVAAGGATAVIDLIVDGVNPGYGVMMAFIFKILIAYAQNYLETAGKIAVMLPTSALVSGPTSAAVATVEATADRAGEIVGDVLDVAGDVVGGVTGQLDKEE